jgi:hypothetical protein
MAPNSQSPFAAAAGAVVLGAALGILFVALFVATSGQPYDDVMRQPEALLPLLLLTLNMSSLFACAAFATAFGGSARDPGNGLRARTKRPGGDGRAFAVAATRVAVRPCRAAASAAPRSRDRSLSDHRR